MPARRTANKDSERARHQVVNWRMSSAYAPRSAAVPGQESARYRAAPATQAAIVP